jgi:tetratricopeptide (TPR) repeat protein
LEETGEACQCTLKRYEEALGPDYILTLAIVNNLGLFYANQGRLEDAEKVYQRALEGYQKTLGSDHTLTLATVENLGLL